MELRFDAMLYSNIANENSDSGHIKCSRGPQVPHPWPGETLKKRKPQPGVEYTPFLNGHHSPADRARELFKPALNGEKLVVKIEKKIFSLRFRPFWPCLHNHRMFLTGLSKHWMTSTSRGSSKIEPISWRETSLDLNGF